VRKQKFFLKNQKSGPRNARLIGRQICSQQSSLAIGVTTILQYESDATDVTHWLAQGRRSEDAAAESPTPPRRWEWFLCRGVLQSTTGPA
jgi:hypothetical protein